MAEARVKRPVAVFFEQDYRVLDCDQHMTMADVSKAWQDATNRSVSVAFLTHDKRYFPDNLTVAEALANSSARVLELHAFPKSTYSLQVFGFEETRAQLQVADILTPAAVRRDIGSALDLYTDDFRLMCGATELDQERPFRDHGLAPGAQLTVDMRVIVKVNFDDSDETRTADCFGSESIGDLRKKLSLNDDTALVTASPYRHMLADPLRVCFIGSDLMDLQIPVEITAEKKVVLAFEPITLPHLRQHLPVALSCTPCDLYNLVSDSFQLTTEHRLAVYGKDLDSNEPLRNQLIDTDDVIQVDILRPCEVFDLWEDPLDVQAYEQVYLFSTESAHALYLRDELSGQRLFHDDINLTIFGAMIDVFGAISGQHKPVLLVDRDVQRSLPMLSFNRVMRRLGWARDMLLDVVPTTGGFLPEIMRGGHLMPNKHTLTELRMNEDTLMILNPEKIFISSDKKLHMCRFAHGATFADVRARMQLLKGSLDIGLRAREWKIPDEALNRRIDRELLFLSSESRFQTKVTATVNGQWFGCWFLPQQVSFSDVMVSVGKQAKVMPRHLFKRALYCCGCGRQLNKQEEPHQTIPDTCCSVRSLQLTDRRVRDIGIQTAVPRKTDVDTYTLDPESRDVCVGTESMSRRAVVSATPGLEGAAAASMRIVAINPEGKEEKKIVTVEGARCRALLAAADRQLAEVAVGDSAVIFSQEAIYDREGERRTALKCYDQRTGSYPFMDLRDGKTADRGSVLFYSLRFLRPSSPLPSSSLPPSIHLQTEVQFLSTAPQGQLQAAPGDAITDPSFVCLLRGVMSGAQLFWRISDLSYANAESGEVFKKKEIPGAPKRHVYALLRDGDPVPRGKAPQRKVLLVWRRDSVELRVAGGRVRCAAPPQPTDIELWHLPKKTDAFRRDFTAAARQQ